MCSKLLKHTPAEKQGRFYRASERVFERVIAFYGRTLQVVLRFQTTTLLVALGTLIFTLLLYIWIPKGFFPQQDTGVIMGGIQADQSISFNAMREKLHSFLRIVEKDPAVQNVEGFTGGGTLNSASMWKKAIRATLSDRFSQA